MAQVIKGCGVVQGRSDGIVLVTKQPISFWGGVDPKTGIINDPRHDLLGRSIAEKVLVFPYAKGSAGAPLVILELARVAKTPAAMINLEAEPLLVSGPIICRHFYGKEMPLVTIDKKAFQEFTTGQHATVDGFSGEIILN